MSVRSTTGTSGPYTHRLGPVQAANGPFTLTVRYQASWWRRPLLWLRHRPRLWEQTFTDVYFSDVVELHDEDGVIGMAFNAEGIEGGIAMRKSSERRDSM